MCEDHCTPETISCGRGARYFAEQASSGASTEHNNDSQHGENHHRCDNSPHNDHHRASDNPHHGGHHHPHHAEIPEAKIMQDFNKCAHYLHHRKGVKQGRSKVLNILKKEKKLTQRELQEKLEIRSASLSELLSKMEASGVIARTQNEADKRTVDVVLTEKGEKACKEQAGGFLAASQELFGGLTDEEQEQLQSILAKLLAAWQPGEGETPGHGREGHHQGKHHGHAHHNGHMHHHLE